MHACMRLYLKLQAGRQVGVGLDCKEGRRTEMSKDTRQIKQRRGDNAKIFTPLDPLPLIRPPRARLKNQERIYLEASAPVLA